MAIPNVMSNQGSSPKFNKRKWILIAIAVAIVAIFLFGRSCGIRSVTKQAGSDTTIHKDSLVIRYKPVPYKVIEHDSDIVFRPWIVEKPVHDTTKGIDHYFIIPLTKEDTLAIVKDYFQTAFYDTTIKLSRGMARLIDTVTENRISGRQVYVTGTDTTITNTIVIKPPRAIVLSFTLSAMGNFRSPLFGEGVGLNLKLPSEGTYDLKLFNVPGHRPMLQFTKGWPLRFKKK
jgi:hypothetical protein